MNNKTNNKSRNNHHIPFRIEWPLTVVLALVKKHQDKRAHIARIQKYNGGTNYIPSFELRYSIFQKGKWVRKVMSYEQIQTLFNDMYGSDGFFS